MLSQYCTLRYHMMYLQKLFVNRLSLSDVILVGHPKSLMIFDTNTSANCGTLIVFLTGMYWASFVNLLTTTSIESYTCLWLLLSSRLVMKSIVISYHSLVGSGDMANSLYSLSLFALIL